MTPKELITKIQRIADTSPKNSHITASDVSRVVSLTFQVLSGLSADEYAATMAKLTAQGTKNRAKAKAAKAKKKAR